MFLYSLQQEVTKTVKIIKSVIVSERLERGGPHADCLNWGEWGLKEYKWKGSFLGYKDCLANTRDFCSALAAQVGQVENIFFLTVHYFISFVHIARKLGRQSCWVACLIVCVSRLY